MGCLGAPWGLGARAQRAYWIRRPWPQPKSNLVRFSFKIRHLVAKISMIFPRINLPNFVQFKQYQGRIFFSSRYCEYKQCKHWYAHCQRFCYHDYCKNTLQHFQGRGKCPLPLPMPPGAHANYNFSDGRRSCSPRS